MTLSKHPHNTATSTASARTRLAIRTRILRAAVCLVPMMITTACDAEDDADALEEPVVGAIELADADEHAADGSHFEDHDLRTVPDADGLAPRPTLDLADAPEDALAVTPTFQMPVFYHQTWRASTYNGHFPNQNSIDLSYLGGAGLGQVVVASAAGTVAEVGQVLSPEGVYFGDYVNIDHGSGWETRYLHIAKSAAIVAGSVVVRGQRLGTVGQYEDMGVHLHYTQLKDGVAQRVAFNGTLINVHMGAQLPNATYPTQDLVSNNIPTGCSASASGSNVTATCTAGAGVRAVAYCVAANDAETARYGSFVAANQNSSAKCLTGTTLSDWSWDLY